jgi:Spy/CpxP family protein refolding chaperone
MKSRFALVAMLALAAAPLAAQGGGGGGGGGGGRRGGGGRGMSVEALTTMYTLTDDQKAKTQTLLDEYNKGAQPLMQYMRSQQQNGATSDPDSMKKSQDLRTDFNSKFKALLTADQSKKFDSVQTAQAARRGGGGGGGR